MKTLQELLQERAELVQAQAALIDAAKVENRDLTDVEAARFEELEQKIVALDGEIEKARVREDREAKVQQRLEGLKTLAFHAPRPGAGRREKDDGGFESLGEFIAAVRFGDPRGRVKAEMRMDVGERGGYAVPEQFRDELLQLTPEEAVVRPRATVIPPGTPPDAKLTIPALDHSQGIYGGVAVQWIGEGAQKPETDAKLVEIALEPHEVAAHVVVTDKLLRNWQAAGTVIRNLLRGAIASAEDVAFLTGDGTSKPLGVLNSAGAIAVNRAAANQIQYVDIVNMLAKLLPDSLGRAVWVANQSVLPQLMQLKDDAGNLIFIRGDATSGIADTLAGLPIRWTGRTPALGQKGDLMLVDFQYYLIKDGSGPFVAASEHVYFRENKTVIKVFWNVDGKGWVASPLTLEDGITQVSPYVVLDVPAT